MSKSDKVIDQGLPWLLIGVEPLASERTILADPDAAVVVEFLFPLPNSAEQPRVTHALTKVSLSTYQQFFEFAPLKRIFEDPLHDGAYRMCCVQKLVWEIKVPSSSSFCNACTAPKSPSEHPTQRNLTMCCQRASVKGSYCRFFGSCLPPLNLCPSFWILFFAATA